MSNIPQDVIDEKHAERGEPPAKRQKLENQQNPLIVDNVNVQQPQRPAMNPMIMNPMINPMAAKQPIPAPNTANMRPPMPPNMPFNPYLPHPPPPPHPHNINMPMPPPPNSMYPYPPNPPQPQPPQISHNNINMPPPQKANNAPNHIQDVATNANGINHKLDNVAIHETKQNENGN